jgi:hypothetical protein
MTSFAFVLGVVPLVVARGAGAEMRRTLGVAVFSGMLGVTLFGIFLTPVFFYVVRGLAGRRTVPARPALAKGPAAPPPNGVPAGLPDSPEDTRIKGEEPAR